MYVREGVSGEEKNFVPVMMKSSYHRHIKAGQETPAPVKMIPIRTFLFHLLIVVQLSK